MIEKLYGFKHAKVKSLKLNQLHSGYLMELEIIHEAY
jgi:hypothetical protein